MGRMEGCCLRFCPRHRHSWRLYVTLAVGVAVVILVTALPSSLCLLAMEQEPAGSLEGLERLGKAQRELQAQVSALGKALAVTNRSLTEALAVTNQSLTEVQGQWESCRNDLDTLKSTISELTQHLAQLQHHRDEQEANAVQLQEDNRKLKEKLAQQQQQLKEAQTGRSNLQSQIWNALAQIQNIRSWHSSGTSVTFPGVAVSLSILALLFVGMLLL